MATLARVRCVWTGAGVIGGGLSTFWTTNSDGAALAADVHDYFEAIKGILPPVVQVIVQPSGETIDEATGELNGLWSGPGVGGSVGTGSAGFAQGVGMRQVWLTNGITNGRRVRGSTFIVPIGSTNYESDGTLGSGVLTAIQAAADALVTAQGGEMCVYSRPALGRAGKHSVVTGAQTPDKVSWLVSRRR